MDTNDLKDQNCKLSTTDYEENDETEDKTEPAKQSPSAEAQMETYIFSPISVVPIIATKSPVFPSSQVPAILSSIYTSRRLSIIFVVTVVATRSPVEIVTRAPIEK